MQWNRNEQAEGTRGLACSLHAEIVNSPFLGNACREITKHPI